jgi:hypothetical protein
MRHRGRTARRLTVASALALAMLTGGVVVGDPANGGWGSGGRGCEQRCALVPAVGYAPPPGGRAPAGWVGARLPGGAAGEPAGTAGGMAPGRASGQAVGAPGPVLGVIGYKPAVLARLDPRTLRPLPGPRIRLAYGVSGYLWSPDRQRLVLGDVDDDALHVIDPVRLRRVATIRFGIVAAAPQDPVWLAPRRLAVVAGNSDGATLMLADPVAGRLLSRRRLAPAGIIAAGAGDRLVLLHTPVEQIGPAHLSVVDDRGRMRTVQLAGVRAGFQNPPDWDKPGAHGITREAALAVDPAGGRAFVVAAGAMVAEVDLGSLRVTYRRLRQPASLLRRLAHWLVPPAEAKQVAGAWRSACWLGDDTLAVWGGDSDITGDTPATQRMDQRPSGVKLIDTRTWTVRPLDPAATIASWQAGRLLAYGGTWDDEAQRQRGVGVTLYGPGDRRPRHLLGSRAVDDAQLNGELLYASVDNGGEVSGRVVVSLRTGRVVSSSDQPLPNLLLDPGRTC